MNITVDVVMNIFQYDINIGIVCLRVLISTAVEHQRYLGACECAQLL